MHVDACTSGVKNMDRNLLSGLLLSSFCLATCVAETTYYKPRGPRIVSHRVGPISGDCWQGELCKQRCLTNNGTAGFVGQINEMSVCCPFCERSGLSISNSMCDCRHNGPDPTYQPTEEELKEVEEFLRQLNSSPMMFANAMLVLASILAVFSHVY